jgi:MFS family permease
MAASRMTWLVVWCLLLVVGSILCIVSFTSSQWVVDKDSEGRSVGLLSHAHTHSFWIVALVLVILGLITTLAATVGSVAILFDIAFKPDAEKHRNFRDKALVWSRKFAWVASMFFFVVVVVGSHHPGCGCMKSWIHILGRRWGVLGLALFVAMILWPIGLDNEEVRSAFWSFRDHAALTLVPRPCPVESRGQSRSHTTCAALGKGAREST